LLLQGGGALGSYQAGVYAALAEAELQPDWVAGISIGAINGALIAGNAPERRVEQLKTFWEKITATPFGLDGWLAPLSQGSDNLRDCMNQASATLALVGGAPGNSSILFKIAGLPRAAVPRSKTCHLPRLFGILKDGMSIQMSLPKVCETADPTARNAVKQRFFDSNSNPVVPTE
jgi:predicted acylesterase/phospholipase RssA